MAYAPREQLYNLFVVYFSDPVNDNIDDEQLVHTIVKEIPPNSLSLIRNKICNLKQEVPFPTPVKVTICTNILSIPSR